MPPKRRQPASHGPGRGRKGPPSRAPKPQGPHKAPRAPRGAPKKEGEVRGERLQKTLAQAGVASRRACEELILQGRVTVDGQVVRELGTRVDARAQKIAVDGQAVQLERHVYYAVYKPRGHVSTNSDPAGRPRVIDLLPEIPQRVYAIGRLDEDSAGLILLTNDGDLANKLAHPKFGVEKVYRVLVAGEPGDDLIQKLTDGVWLAEGKARAKRAWIVGRKGQATTLEMVLAEGKNREVRRMLAKMGHKVMSLTRVAVGPITVRGLKPGGWRSLTRVEVEQLRRVAAGEAVRPFGPPRHADRPATPRRGAGRARAGAATPPPSAPAPRQPRPPAVPTGQRRPSGPAKAPPPPRGRRPAPPLAPPPASTPASAGRAERRPRPTGPKASPPTPKERIGRTVIGLDQGPPEGRRASRPAPRKRPVLKPRKRQRPEEGGDE